MKSDIVTFPSIQTTARDSKTEDHVANATDSVSIIDTVTYFWLESWRNLYNHRNFDGC